MAADHGFADYLLFVDGQAVGALEAKPEGYPLSSVEPQVKLYSEGLPKGLPAPLRPLPFLYLSTGVETRFANLLDPEHRTRPVFAVHRPETLAEWLRAETLEQWLAARAGGSLAAEASQDFGSRPSTLRARLRRMPPVHIPNLWPNKIEALQNLERSFAADRPRALSELARQPEVRLALDNDALFQVAENMIYLRKHRKLTQATLARKMGTSQAKVARIEGGRENVTLRTLEKAVLALEGRLGLSIAPAEFYFPGLPSWWSMADAVGADSPYRLHFVHVVESGSGSLKVGAGWSGAIRTLPSATLLTESSAA